MKPTNPGAKAMTPDIDYRDLLKRYIAYVEAAEGTHFLYHYCGYTGDPTFTPKEWAELQSMAGVS